MEGKLERRGSRILKKSGSTFQNSSGSGVVIVSNPLKELIGLRTFMIIIDEKKFKLEISEQDKIDSITKVYF